METLVRAVGALSCLTLCLVALMIVAPLFAPPDEQNEKGGDKDNPVLAMEFMGNEAQVSDFLGARDADGDSVMRRKIRRGLAWDNLFIATYWLLFIGLSLLLSRRAWPGRAALWLAVFAALCGTGAAISDTVENARTLVLLDAAKVTKPLHQTLAMASSEKWLLIGLATLALSFVFLWTGDAKSRLVGGLLFLFYLAVGALMILGVLAGSKSLITSAFLLYLCGLIGVAGLFTFGARWVAERLRRGRGGV
ncbi:MAG: hypothetical protein M3379_22000 [Acidobacteriota bacterium]|nr:hypothetical protein [Acidobacteriota bacterium]